MTHGFTGSAILSEGLQKALNDVTALSLVGKQLHWNVVGVGFRGLHLYLDEVVAIARTASDDIAERMRAVNLIPDGRPQTIAELTTLPAAPEAVISVPETVEAAVAAINATVATMRQVHEKVDAEDSASADILLDYVRQLEQQAWFIRSSVDQA
ncbi:DNA starvation/stationary phase protection protein [Arcanobacterium haemolyticum]|uniref:Ferritin Dps family protein n=1 Tax=Arcanobacterium haemolyticum (strain ATCC 9345 / DSM 20595 / CCM 5947 / CCUG 17215 / LMG 16163 / NBRC 15585 / NCTC 8452 / 11018) TaxID=644284 RepID=D7BKI8_ARCHD|nr:DNA starvation/stationary phase protection protein [Arcanobacterium haemolyticum]ADH93168.1 Ferritin Dps family protein [Arcanobacterium haemolyticum DSM 20595]QCX47223.1 DNA starvation/stationary phase protection protein [Arcanobacterium haemolyticum]SQH28074.1 DNA protection during starvation protein [Arcanobacterium haemolyticum]